MLLSLVLFSFLENAFAAAPTEAFYVEPMEFSVRAPFDAVQKLTVINKDDHEVKIHVDIFERSDSLDGSENRKLTTDVVSDASEFSVAKGASKIIQLTYVGKGKPKRERAFRIVVRQMGATNDASLDLRFVYVASMYVTPDKAEPEIVVRDVKRTSEREIEVGFHNVGNAHGQLSGMSALVEQGARKGDRALQLSNESLKMLARQNLLAGSRRKLILQFVNGEKIENGPPISLKLVKR